jgi:apolipoprotein N-acyltransferase
MNETPWYLGIGLAVASALLLLLAFPVFDVNLLAFVALVPILYVTYHTGLRRTLGYAVVFSFLFFCLLLFWMNAYLAVVGVAFVTVAYGVYFVLALLCINLTSRAFPAYRALLTPFIWVAFDFLRSFGFLGMTFGSMGYTQHSFLRFIQIADIGGEQLVAFVIILFNASLADLLARLTEVRRRGFDISLRGVGVSRLATLGASVLLIAFSLVYGTVRYREPLPESPRVKLALIQALSSPRTEWDEEKWGTLKRLTELSRQAYLQDPDIDLVVWTETAIRTALRPNFIYGTPYHMRIRRLVRELGVWFLIGSPDHYDVAVEGEQEVAPEKLEEIYPNREEVWTNSAYLIDPQGEIVQKYDKIQLTPFGEHFPLGERLPFMQKILDRFTDSAGFIPGAEYTVFRHNPLQFGTVICWEGTYGYYIRRFVRGGADFMLNISNDMWSGTRAGHFQHFTMTKLRAVENRIWLARAANDGVTAFVNPRGEVTAMLPIKETGFLIGEVGPRVRETFYTRHGNILPAVSLGVLALSLFSGIFLVATGRRDAYLQLGQVEEALASWSGRGGRVPSPWRSPGAPGGPGRGPMRRG